MINKRLIANRGEIAARVIRTCKNLNIDTVAVYSEADQKAPFVAMADESFLLGPPRVQDSYLNTDKIISIAKEANVDAIHPGYGFLSEYSQFADKCEHPGSRFIGLSAEWMEKMRSIIAARNALGKAAVSVLRA